MSSIVAAQGDAFCLVSIVVAVISTCQVQPMHVFFSFPGRETTGHC